MRIQLTEREMRAAALHGVDRNITSRRSGHQHKYGYAGDAWANSIEAAIAEYSTAKLLNRFWKGVEGIGAEDVAGGIEVRWSRYPNPHLILHPDDTPQAIYVLVTGWLGDYELRGWIVGSGGMRDQFWCDRAQNNRPAYWVPQTALDADFGPLIRR